MSDAIVHNFRVSHQAIIETMSQMQTMVRSYSEIKPLLRVLHEQLLGHLGRQDNDFFDKIKKYMSDSRESQKILEFLNHDAKDFKVQYLLFFDQHSGEMDDLNSRSFSFHFTQFSKKILGRIQIEEEYLIPLLQKMAD